MVLNDPPRKPAWCALTVPQPRHSSQKTGREPARLPEPTQSGQALLAETCWHHDLPSHCAIRCPSGLLVFLWLRVSDPDMSSQRTVSHLNTVPKSLPGPEVA